MNPDDDDAIYPSHVAGFAATMGNGGVGLVLMQEIFTLQEGKIVAQMVPAAGFTMHHTTAKMLVESLGAMLGLEAKPAVQN